jgi:hypothetical protein
MSAKPRSHLVVVRRRDADVVAAESGLEVAPAGASGDRLRGRPPSGSSIGVGTFRELGPSGKADTTSSCRILVPKA